MRSRSKNSISAVIVAAGASNRFKGKTKKQFVEVKGMPLFLFTASALARMPEITEIIIVLPAEKIKVFEPVIKRRAGVKLKAVVAGGSTRAESVSNALKFVSEDSSFVLVQDGVRPFVERSYIKGCLVQLKKYDGAVVGIPVRDTLKRTNSTGVVRATVPRGNLYHAQTPQIFKKDILIKAYSSKDINDATDDSMLVERIGGSVVMVEGSPNNIKLTTKEDIVLFNHLVRKRSLCTAQV